MSAFKPNVAKLKKRKNTGALIRALDNEDRSVRTAAVEALGELGDSRAVLPLISLLEDPGEETALREQVCAALGLIGGPRAVEALASVLKDDDWDVRGAAAEALSEIAWEPGTHETAISYWISRLVSYDYDNDCHYVNGEAVDALVKIGGPAVEPLIDLLHQHDRLLRSAAIAALGMIGDRGAVEPLVSVLEEEDNWLRKKAADSLGDIASEEGVKPLVSVIGDCARSKGVCKAAINALVKIGDRRAVEPLVSVLQDDDVRKVAEKALEQLRG